MMVLIVWHTNTHLCLFSFFKLFLCWKLKECKSSEQLNPIIAFLEWLGYGDHMAFWRHHSPKSFLVNNNNMVHGSVALSIPFSHFKADLCVCDAAQRGKRPINMIIAQVGTDRLLSGIHYQTTTAKPKQVYFLQLFDFSSDSTTVV